MDLMSSALTGALRVGVQVVVARRRPVLEIFYNFHNDYSPEVDVGGISSRFQHVYTSLTLVNLGGTRAENVTFGVAGSFRRELFKGEQPALLKSTIQQMAPGQSHYLMRIEQGDLHEWLQSGKNDPAKKMGDLKSSTLTITVHYDAELTLLNRILRQYRRWRGLKQYQSTFVFDPQNFAGDLPPPNYA